MAKGGKEHRRNFGAFERIFGATIFFSTESSRSTATVVHRSRFSFLREAEIWYSRTNSTTTETNVITLSDEFYAGVSGQPIPADLEVIRLLAAAPALLDLCMGLSYRCFVAKGPEGIPLFGSFGLTQQLGCVEYSRPSRFRAMLEQWVRTIRSLWPECPAFVSADGSRLRIACRAAILPIPKHQGPDNVSALAALNEWIARPEAERLEFKEAKNNFHFERLAKYCAALSKEGDGAIVVGVTDRRPRRVVGTTAFDEESIKEGKPQPSFLRTDDYQVMLTLKGQIQSPDLLRSIKKIGRERLSSFTTEDFLVLDSIQRDEPIPDAFKERQAHLAGEGIIERVGGSGRSSRFILSRSLYSFIGKRGVYT